MPNYSIYLILIWLVLSAFKPARKIVLALTPWLIFACSYDWMRLLPNYVVNPNIDTVSVLELERQLFGINTEAGRLIPGEYFNLHHHAWQDMLAGFFYLCWVPVPLGYALTLYFKGKKRESLRMSIAFLWVNLVGFSLYYVHPTAPPWYTLEHGAEIIHNTPGNMAALARFDQLTHIPVFAFLYNSNANVFAAIPSLHAAYVLIAAIYAVINKSSRWTAVTFFVIAAGIWWTAAYTTHHYLIDVLLGILTAVVGIAILECGFFRIAPIKRAVEKYAAAI